MNLDAKGIAFIKKSEGLELISYNKDGKWTIGYGNTFYENGSPVKKGDKISKERAESLFSYVVKTFAVQVSNLIKVSVSQNQFNALVSLAYNIGITNFSKSTLLRLVNNNPNDKNIRNEFLKWVYSQGKILQGLVNRRKSEIELYFLAGSNVFPSSGGSDLIVPLVALSVISILIYNSYSNEQR